MYLPIIIDILEFTTGGSCRENVKILIKAIRNI